VAGKTSDRKAPAGTDRRLPQLFPRSCRISKIRAYARVLGRSSGFRIVLLAAPSRPRGAVALPRLSSPVTAARLRRIHTVFPWPVFMLRITSFQRCSNECILQDQTRPVNPPHLQHPSDPSDQAYCLIFSSRVSPVFSGSVITRRRCQPTSGDITSVMSAAWSNSSVRSPESFP